MRQPRATAALQRSQSYEQLHQSRAASCQLANAVKQCVTPAFAACLLLLPPWTHHQTSKHLIGPIRVADTVSAGLLTRSFHVDCSQLQRQLYPYQCRICQGSSPPHAAASSQPPLNKPCMYC